MGLYLLKFKIWTLNWARASRRGGSILNRSNSPLPNRPDKSAGAVATTGFHRFLEIIRLKPTGLFMRKIIRIALACACLFSLQVWAADGYVFDAAGKVSIAVGKNAPHPAAKNDAIRSDTEINTGDKSYAVLKFEDGQAVAMQANTAFHITEYRYDPKQIENSNIIFSTTKGGIRFITGSVGQNNQKGFRLSTPNATIGISGSDFAVAAENNVLYSRVNSGSITMTNAAGTASFKTGETVIVETVRTLPRAIPATSLPPGIFSGLDAIPAAAGLSASPAVIPAAAVGAAKTSPVPAPISAASAMPGSEPSARTISITGAGNTYIGADLLCDFCTGRSKTVGTHIDSGSADDGTVTGDATLFGKHNLTATGANTGEICAFCHTPQGAEDTVSAPRWNRSLTTLSSYRAYASLGSAVSDAAGSISMACLSCHDGGQAPNIVMNTPDLRLNVGDDLVDVGNTLKAHHPVGIQYAGGGQDQYGPDISDNTRAGYDRLVDMNKFAALSRFGVIYRNFGRDAFGDVLSFSNEGNFLSDDPVNPDSTYETYRGGFNKSTYSGSGSGTVWWIKTPGSKKGRQKTDLYLFTRTDTIEDALPSESVLNRPYIECATCHDPHSVNPTFLRLPGGNANSQICLSCHNK
ncbi:MAG: FecR domain-containing protein [Gallionella sp.]